MEKKKQNSSDGTIKYTEQTKSGRINLKYNEIFTEYNTKVSYTGSKY